MSNARPGTALKSLRKSNRWTLLDVSNRTGIPPSTLSRIENDQISPTYDLLLKLSKGLSIDLSQLLSMATTTPGEGSDQPGRRSVNRSGDGEAIDLSNHTVRYLSNDLLKKQITPLLCEYRARSLEEFGEFMRHEGEEFLYVIDGELELHTECYAPLLLKAGESIYFDSRMGHAYISRSEAPCHALSVCTVPQPVGMKQLIPGKASERVASEMPALTDPRRTEVSGRRAGPAKRKRRRSA